MSKTDEIFDYFEYINHQNRAVSLVTTYHGVSISLEVDILKVSRKTGDVTVATRRGQNMSLLPATYVLIHSDLFSRPIHAIVATIDVHHREAVLKSFVYSPSTDDGRKEVRMQPKEIRMARVALQGQPERVGKVNDISVEGISITLRDQHVDLGDIFLPKTSVRLYIDLPLTDQPDQVDLSYRATVTYVNPGNVQSEYRVGFMTYPSDKDKVVLRRYIFDQQTELFSEIGKEPPVKKGSAIIS
jgi:hypothetical protein